MQMQDEPAFITIPVQTFKDLLQEVQRMKDLLNALERPVRMTTRAFGQGNCLRSPETHKAAILAWSLCWFQSPMKALSGFSANSSLHMEGRLGWILCSQAI